MTTIVRGSDIVEKYYAEMVDFGHDRDGRQLLHCRQDLDASHSRAPLPFDSHSDLPIPDLEHSPSNAVPTPHNYQRRPAWVIPLSAGDNSGST